MYITHSRLAISVHYCYCYCYCISYILHDFSPFPSEAYTHRLHQSKSITIRTRHNCRPPGLNRQVPALDNEARVPNERRVLEGLVLLVSDLERQIRRCNHGGKQSGTRANGEQIRTAWAERQLPLERRTGQDLLHGVVEDVGPVVSQGDVLCAG